MDLTAMRGLVSHVSMKAFMEGLTISSITLLSYSTRISDHKIQGAENNTPLNIA